MIFRAYPVARTTFTLENVASTDYFRGQYPTSAPGPFYNAVESVKYQQWILPLDYTSTTPTEGDPAYHLTFPPVAADLNTLSHTIATHN
jgi:hypothetical protein